MGKTDPSAPSYWQQSMVLVPKDTPGVEIVRDLLVFGYNDRESTPKRVSPMCACRSTTWSPPRATAL